MQCAPVKQTPKKQGAAGSMHGAGTFIWAPGGERYDGEWRVSARLFFSL